MTASSQRSERAEDRTSPHPRERDVLRAGGRAPIGAIVLVGALAAVFVYGIYLKSTSRGGAGRTGSPPTSEPSPPGQAAQGTTTPGSSTMGHLERVPPGSAAGRGRGAGILTTPEPELAQRPLIPESPGSPSAPAPGPAGASPQRPSPTAPSSTPPRPVAGAAPPPPASGSAPEPAPGAGSPPAEIDEEESDATSVEGSGTGQDSAGADDDGEGPGGEPTGDHATARPPILDGGSGAPTTIPRTIPAPTSPRGTAPATAEQRARDGFRAHRYAEAARLWKEWARSVPAGSYTVQIAAVQLDRPATGQVLASLTGREGLFVLPPGPVTHDLSPVCVGVYPSIQDARSAAATEAPFPGSSSRPFPRRIDSLANGS